MPRPKVHPSQRRRAAEACNFCRMSKKRCSATVPCTACQRRGIASTCYLTNRPRGSRSMTRRQTSLAENPASAAASGADISKSSNVWTPARTSPQERSTWLTDTSPIAGESGSYQPISPSDSRTGAVDIDHNATPNSSALPEASTATPPLGRESHARMLLNLRGERVYIGEAASLSFLKFVRETVAAQIGPSQFSHNDQSENMLETEPTISVPESITPAIEEMDATRRHDYVKAYRVATGGFLDLFSPAEMELLLSSPAQDTPSYPNRHKEAVMDAAVAIGALCQSSPDGHRFSQLSFRRAQRKAFTGMLEDPNLDVVRAFLLMAFYMLGACRRNAAFMYLGVACRAAVSLGLHSRDSYQDLDNVRDRIRLKVWLSLCILDMLVSSILGRPSATTGLRDELDETLIADAGSAPDRDSDAIFASYKILSIINEAVDTLYKKKQASVSRIEQYLQKIEDWSQSLPSNLRVSPESYANLSPEREIIGKIHVSCIYYFAVTLVTRPVLISTLTTRTMASTSTLSPLASACLDAAVYLVQTCLDAKKAGLLLGNMFIMKALVFAAGLILGFDMFAKRELDCEIESAFRGAREVLDFIAVQSPQAALYSEILGLLSNAIAKQRDQLASRGRSKLVSRLFSISRPTDDEESHEAFERAKLSAPPALGFTLGEGNSGWISGQGGAQQTALDESLLSGWDSLDLSQWDNFPFYSPRNFMNE